MRQSLLVLAGLLPALVMAVTGCAHRPPPAAAGELNVMQVASDMGFNEPKVIDGKTLYCQQEELTGSLVPKLACIDEDEVIAKARAQGDLLRYMASAPMAVGRPQRPQTP